MAQTPTEVLEDAAAHADLMLRLVDIDTGSQPNRAEYEAHLLKTLTVIGGALVEALPSEGIESFPRSKHYTADSFPVSNQP